MLRKLIIDHKVFMSLFAIYMMLGAVGFIFYKQGEETLFFNSHHTVFLDYFFWLCTCMAEVVFLSLIGFMLLFYRLKLFLVYIIDISIVAIVVGFLKFAIFADRIRPALFFSGQYKLNFGDGIPILTVNSFPSGHTTLAFAVFFLLAIFISRVWSSLLLLIMALLVGISRIYLLEHFWIDVYFGSLIGILITVLVYIASQKSLIHSDRRWLNLSLYERYFKKKQL